MDNKSYESDYSPDEKKKPDHHLNENIEKQDRNNMSDSDLSKKPEVISQETDHQKKFYEVHFLQTPPLGHLCRLSKAYKEQDYGFKIFVDKTKGPFIDLVDIGSPAHLCGLRDGDILVAVNEERITGMKHNEIAEKILDNPLDCTLLVIGETDALWYRNAGIEIPLEYDDVFPDADQTEMIGMSRAARMNIVMSCKGLHSTKSVESVNDSCFKCPWSSNRSRLVIIIILVIFGIACIVGAAVIRFPTSSKKYIITWILTDNYTLNSSLLNFEKTSESTAMLDFKPSWMKTNVRTSYDFDKNLILHRIDNVDLYFVMPMNETKWKSIDILYEGAKTASKDPTAYDWKENWNYRLTPLDSITFQKLNKTIHKDIIRRFLLLHEEDVTFREKSCNNCSEICLPDYGLIRNSKSNEITLVLIDGLCFWLEYNGDIPQFYSNTTSISA